MFCYVRFVPDNDTYAAFRKDVHESMRTGKKPNYYSTGLNWTGPGNVKWEMKDYQPPTLTELGEKLLGEKDWE